MHSEPAKVSAMGITSGHLENLSTMVNKCVYTWEEGNGPMTSMCMCSNLALGIGICCAGGCVCLITLECWQSTHQVSTA